MPKLRGQCPCLAARLPRCALLVVAFVSVAPALAGIDLRNASVEKLDNGLTVILLEDRRFPAVSVQALYRVGARNEVTGKTGLAHFLEHMAFRDSRNFPDTQIVSQIYAVGGEWHGYTWIDQTTYFSTVPREHADLLLRIEADRMSALEIEAADMEAERGAVLAELHMYENLPTSMLIDAVNFTSFLAHPYRNNTIGWESDIVNLAHADVLAFYQAHYHPANATIAVVGDFDRTAFRARIDELFGHLPQRPPTPAPHTLEPPQDGVRRVELRAADSRREFMIAYRAPSASSPDYASFLVLQELLGTGSGSNFLQNDWGTPVAPDAPLFAAADEMTTWFPPSAQDYVFIIGGRAPPDASTATIETRVEARVAALRDARVAETTLAQAISDVTFALEQDVQTTEDAAHQLAFFDGLGALDDLFDLPRRVRAVTPDDVQKVARRYLDPAQRSIAWHLPGGGLPAPDAASASRPLPPASPPAAPGELANPDPFVRHLGKGLPVVGQVSDFSPLVEVLVVFPTNALTGVTADDPILGHSSLRYAGSADRLPELLDAAVAGVAAVEPLDLHTVAPASDPAARLEEEIDALLDPAHRTVAVATHPVLVAVAGDFTEDELIAGLEQRFGAIAPGSRPTKEPPEPTSGPRLVHLERPLAQAQLGYIAGVPGPRDPLAEAVRLSLYVLSHDYEGRLGKQAISNAGLAYYIDSRYRSDGSSAWITLTAGVDPDKLEPLRQLFAAELARLVNEPPTATELRDARQHRLGRKESAAQSNAELSTELATEWLWHGELRTAESLADALDDVDLADLEAAARILGRGVEIIVGE